MAIHAKPDDAVIEIDHLTDVYDNVYDTWGVKVWLEKKILR